MQLLDGKRLSEKLKVQIAEETRVIESHIGRKPHLVAVLIGNDGASETYVANKIKSCQAVGIQSTLLRYDSEVTEAFLLQQLETLNTDPAVDGILVQLPLPEHINTERVIERIDYRKDVDGFHPINMGRMKANLPAFLPATPYGIMLLLKEYGIETVGKHCVVIGRSDIVGSPVSILMARDAYPGNCTVTLCHILTPDIKIFTRQADILIVATGNKHLITGDMVKEGVVVIDVGMNREMSAETRSGYKLYGDVDFEGVSTKASWITPVPGGVGPMTIIGLLKNTIMAASHPQPLAIE